MVAKANAVVPVLVDRLGEVVTVSDVELAALSDRYGGAVGGIPAGLSRRYVDDDDFDRLNSAMATQQDAATDHRAAKPLPGRHQDLPC